IWSEVLGLPVEDAQADFFELGGHSLVAVQVLSRLREACKVELSISEFFERPRLCDLASRVEAAQSASVQVPQPPLVADAVPTPARPLLRSVGTAVGPRSLYLIPPAHGLGLSYEELGHSLHLPVVVLEAPLRALETSPLGSLEDIA